MQPFPEIPLPAPHRTLGIRLDTSMPQQHHLSIPQPYYLACLLVLRYHSWVQKLIFTMSFLFLLAFIVLQHQRIITCPSRTGSFRKIYKINKKDVLTRQALGVGATIYVAVNIEVTRDHQKSTLADCHTFLGNVPLAQNLLKVGSRGKRQSIALTQLLR